MPAATSTAIDYDAPRQNPDGADSLEQLQAQLVATDPAVVDVDDSVLAESYASAGVDLPEEELAVPVIPIQADEFRCSRCFLVQHKSMRGRSDYDVCVDCT